MNEEIITLNIFNILEAVKKNILVFLVIVFSFILLAYLVSITLPSKYEANITLMPVSQLGEEDKTSGLGAVSSLLGNSSISTEIPAWMEATTIMNTREFAKQFILSQKIMNDISAQRGVEIEWNNLTEEEKNIELNKLARFWIAYNILVEVDENTNTISFSVFANEPSKAVTWATNYVCSINEYMKEYLFQEAERKIQFYRERYAEESISDVKVALVNLMTSAIQQKALLTAQDESVFRIIDPAGIATIRFPILPLNLAIGAFLGLLFGFISIIVMISYAQYKKIRV